MAEMTLPQNAPVAPTPEAPKTSGAGRNQSRTDYFNAREEIIVNVVIYGTAALLLLICSFM